MMQKLINLIFLILFTGSAFGNSLTVITYHDIVADASQDIYAVTRAEFVAQKDYLKDNGYRPISLSFLEKFQKNQARLPQKAVMLTFDDGLLSYHDFVVPILKIYNFPSIDSLVTSWLDGKNIPNEYKNKLMNWKHAKELNKSKLVEFVSHTHSLHTGVLSNAHGNDRPAAITRQFFPFNQSYETVGEYRQRIKYDLGVSVLRFVKKIGKAPIGITWPYGKFNRIAVEEATKLGMKFQLTLENGPTTVKQIPMISRFMLVNNPPIEDFANELNYAYIYDDPLQFVEVNLEPFLGQASWKQEEMLGRLLDELQRRKVNMVIISPFSKKADFAFFQTDQLKVGTDVLNRVIHQMQDRIPINKIIVKIPGYIEVENLDRLYEDLASLNWFDGVVFSNKVKVKTASRIKRVMGQYRPRLTYGIWGEHKTNFAYDFIVYPMNTSTTPDKMKKEGVKISKINKKVYVYLKTGPKITGRQLKTAIQSLQVTGVKHYGYQLDKLTFAPKKSVVRN